MAEEEKSRSMWTNVDLALGHMQNQMETLIGHDEAVAFVKTLETLVTELVKAPPRGKNHPSRSK